MGYVVYVCARACVCVCVCVYVSCATVANAPRSLSLVVSSRAARLCTDVASHGYRLNIMSSLMD